MSIPDFIYVAHVVSTEVDAKGAPKWQEKKTFMPKADGSPSKKLIELLTQWEPPTWYPVGHRYRKRLATVTVYKYNVDPTPIAVPHPAKEPVAIELPVGWPK